MKYQQLLAVAATLLLPTFCSAQAWQVASPAATRPGTVQPYQSAIPGMNPGVTGTAVPPTPVASPTPVPTPTPAAVPYTMPANQMAVGPMAAGGGYGVGCDGGVCGGGGCDAGGYGGGMVMGGGCDSGGIGGGSMAYGGGSSVLSGGCDSIGCGDCFDGCDTGCCSTGCCGGGTYFSIFAGVADLDRQISTGYQRDLQIDYDQGYGIGGAIGRRVGRFFRTEVEYVYRSQTPGIVNFNGVPQGNISGQQSSHAGMMNLVYDMIIGNGNLVPYLGGGLGVAGVDSQVRYGNMGATLNGDDTGLAFQWMAGLTYRARPNMEMFVEYRFFEVDNPKLNRFGGPPVNGGPTNLILDSEYVSNDIFAGLRFNW